MSHKDLNSYLEDNKNKDLKAPKMTKKQKVLNKMKLEKGESSFFSKLDKGLNKRFKRK